MATQNDTETAGPAAERGGASGGRLLETLEREGYLVLRGVVPQEPIERALRLLHLDVLRRGLTSELIAEYHGVKCWFPHLRWEPEILALAEHVPPELRAGTPCDPQILLNLPDEAEVWPLEPHLDETPPWAAGRPYRTIVGVALTPGRERNGGLVVWPFRQDGPVPVELDAGDVVVMHPRLPHTGGLNREGSIRYAIYFRYLEE